MKSYRRSPRRSHPDTPARPSSAPTTPRRLAALTLGLAVALAAAGPARGAVTDTTVRSMPLAPTWADSVRLQIDGESDCLVRLVSVEILTPHEFPLPFQQIYVVLAETCSFVPPQVRPFHLETVYPHLDPDHYVVTVVTAQAGVVAETLFTVHDRAQLLIEAPRAPTDAEPFTFTVSGFTSGCLLPEPPEVDGAAIVAQYPDSCPILPPGPDVRTYDYEVGPLPAGDYEIQAYRNLNTPDLQVATRQVHVYAADGCVPSETTLCLQDDRFRVQVSWKDFQGGQGDGHALPLPDRDDTGLFWFFNPANVELTVKVLDGCPVNGHFWVFAASGSTVEYEITVTDTQEDVTRTYGNDLGVTPSLIPDTGAFATCP